MKKQLAPAAIALGSLLAASSASAGHWFIGGQLGKAKIDQDIRYFGGSKHSIDEKSTELGLRAGKMYDNYRLMGTVTYNAYHSNEEQAQYLFSADYFFGQGPLRPFVGVSAGINYYEFANRDDSALAYGAQAGLRYRISRNLSLEGGVQHLRHDNEIYYFGNRIETDRTHKAFVALDYRF